MKLDPTMLRYLTKSDFRILTAIEMGMRNHDMVPIELIQKISCLNSSATRKSITIIHKYKLVHHEFKKYDGYRLTFLGYDFLALQVFVKRNKLAAIGRQIGVGKESDVFQAADENKETTVLKLHRLGRISFRSVKSNRDYLRSRTSSNWLYTSRLAAKKEYDFLRILWDADFPVPKPIDQNRHCILMENFDAVPLKKVKELPAVGLYYKALINLLKQLADLGFVHCDFNEFNLMISIDKIDCKVIEDLELSDKSKPLKFDKNVYETMGITLIDFPQMVSTKHKDAEELFLKDLKCLKTFFSKAFRFNAPESPEINISEIISTQNLQKLSISNTKTDSDSNTSKNDENDKEDKDNKNEKISIETEKSILDDLKLDRMAIEKALKSANRNIKSKTGEMTEEEIRERILKNRRRHKGSRVQSNFKKERSKLKSNAKFLIN